MGKSIVDHIPEFSKCFWLPSLKDSLLIFPQVFGMKSKFINLRKPRQWEFFLGDLSFGIPHSEVEDDEMGVSSYRWKIPAVAIGKSCCPKYSKFVSEFVVPPSYQAIGWRIPFYERLFSEDPLLNYHIGVTNTAYNKNNSTPFGTTGNGGWVCFSEYNDSKRELPTITFLIPAKQVMFFCKPYHFGHRNI